MGNWEGRQIDDLSIYSDGVIAAAPAGTDITSGIVDDLFRFVEQEYDFEMTSPQELRHYESALVVELPENIASRFTALYSLSQDLSEFQRSYGLGDHNFEFARIGSFVDPTRRTGRVPLGFNLERREGEPYSDNRWYCSAPLKTEDHLTALANFEAALS